MMPARFAPVVFGFLLSGLMSFVVSGVSTALAGGWPGLWLGAWLSSWAIAFPTVLVVAPLARRLVARMTEPSSPPWK